MGYLCSAQLGNTPLQLVPGLALGLLTDALAHTCSTGACMMPGTISVKRDGTTPVVHLVRTSEGIPKLNRHRSVRLPLLQSVLITR